MRIAQNDPRAAHAVVRGELQAATWKIEDTIYTLALPGTTMRQGAEMLAAQFPGGVLHEDIKRPSGGRALARWDILAPEHEDRLHLVQIEYDARRRHGWASPWAARSLGVLVSHHALARCGQRTVGRGELCQLIPTIRAHVLAAARAQQVGPILQGDTYRTIDSRGVLLWGTEPPRDGRHLALIARTWLDGATLADRSLRELVRLARNDAAPSFCRGVV